MFRAIGKWFGDRTYYKRRAARLDKKLQEVKKELLELAKAARAVERAYTKQEADLIESNNSRNILHRWWREEREKVARLENQNATLRAQLGHYINNPPSHSEDNQAFTTAELKAMIRLCHPDKHGGKKSATEITQKLNSMVN